MADYLLRAQARTFAVEIAWAVYTQSLDIDGSILYKGDAGRSESADKHCWAHAEALVGFYNAYQISEHAQFAQAAVGCWEYIEELFVDRQHSEWFKVLNRRGIPYREQHIE
jgi:mannobiose 2-epimerase